MMVGNSMPIFKKSWRKSRVQRWLALLQRGAFWLTGKPAAEAR